MQQNDLLYMRQALEYARLGADKTKPNPLVGAVLVKDEKIIGSGWHRCYGSAHAEVEAVQSATEDVRGATLYVTLEPCCHFGKTPPCTELIIRSGIRRVVCAMADPFPEVNGQGIRRLKHAGIEVDVGIAAKEAWELNRHYFHAHLYQRPYIYGKIATTLDGRTTTGNGQSKWITNEAARRDGRLLRARVDAISVGIGTILVDDPKLTVRDIPVAKQPIRVIWDTWARTPLDSQILAEEGRTYILVGIEANAARISALSAKGAEVLRIPQDASGKLDIAEGLKKLVEAGIHSLLVEGGGTLLGGMANLDVLDEIHAYMAPVLAGSQHALNAIGGQRQDAPATALTYEIEDICCLADNLRIIYRRKRCLQD